MNRETHLYRYRNLQKGPKALQTVLLISIVLFGVAFNLRVHIYLKLNVYTEQWIGLFLTLFLICTFLSLPATKKEPRNTIPWYDIILCILALPAGLWLTIKYPSIISNLGHLNLDRVLVATIAIILIIEAARRLIGLSLVIIAGMFILYGILSHYLPGRIAGPPVSWSKLVNYLYLDPNSILNFLGLAATIAVAFVFFGQILLNFGGSDALTKIAIYLLGRMRGGPAKAAVLGSSLVGTMTGAPASNVFLTGSVTIPMMIKSGYSPRFAGAVEAVSSSGGQIMPPVMGIAAFIIAERLGIPYAEVALAALIPALLYYIALFVQVDLEAGKLGLKGLSKEEIPKFREIMVEILPVIPVIFLLVLTIFVLRMSPGLAAVISGLLGIPFLILRKQNRTDFFSRLKNTFIDTGRLLLDGASALAIAGIVVGVVSISGLGFSLGYLLTVLGENNMFLLLVLAAIGSIILGMGMPSVAAYALVAVLIAPALTEFGLNVLAVHLFIFYFSIVSNFTPPIAIAVFAASILTGSEPMRMGLTAMRLGILAYIVPFIFVYSPSLILSGTPFEILITFITALLGTIGLGVSVTGYLFNTIPWLYRVIILIGSLLIIYPFNGSVQEIVINVIGIICCTSAVLITYFKHKNNNIQLST